MVVVVVEMFCDNSSDFGRRRRGVCADSCRRCPCRSAAAAVPPLLVSILTVSQLVVVEKEGGENGLLHPQDRTTLGREWAAGKGTDG